MNNKSLFNKIRRTIRSTLFGLLIFFVSIFCGLQVYSFFARSEQIETLVSQQVDSLASNRAIAKNYLEIQQELSRFLESMKTSLRYNIKVSVRLSDRLVAADGALTDSIFPTTKIEKERVLPSGDKLSVATEIGNNRVIFEAIGLLVLIILSALGIYSLLILRLENAFEAESKPIREKLDKAVVDQHRAEIAEQVAHDIRSPLTTLDLAIKEADIPPDQRISIQKSITRMSDVLNDIANPKIDAHGTTDEVDLSVKDEYVTVIAQDILSEKRRQWSDNKKVVIEMLRPLTVAVAPVNRRELSRALSNIIDNAYQAIEGVGQVQVSIESDNDFVSIKISDDGQGISEERLSAIGTRGVTFGKSGGHGLGLFHAKETMRQINGELSIESQAGQGTSVTLKFPKSKNKSGLCDRVSLAENQKLVIVDDDDLIHQVWKMKSDVNRQKLAHFYSPEEFESKFTKELISSSFFIVDFEFKNSLKNGINLITEFELQDRAILVSGKWDSPEIALECEYFGIKRFPKELLEQLPIVFESNINRVVSLEQLKMKHS